MKSILIILIVLIQVGFAGILRSKYDFQQIETYEYVCFDELKFDPEIYPNFIILQQSSKMQSPPYSRIKIQDLDLRNITAINSDRNDIFYPCFIFDDYDQDGFDEIIIPSLGDYKIRFTYFDRSFADEDRKDILTLPTDKEKHYGGIYCEKFHYDDDKDFEILICLANNYPKKNAIRGVFAVDPQTSLNLWNYYSAYQIRSPFTMKINNTKEINIFSTSGVSNGLAYSRGNFYHWNRTLQQYIQDTTVEDSPKIELLDTTSPDFSIDTIAVVFALDKDGRKLWETKIGGVFTWNVSFKFNDLILCSTEYRHAKAKYEHGFHLIDPVNGNIERSIYLKKGEFKSYHVSDENLFILRSDNSFRIYNYDFNIIESKKLDKDMTIINTSIICQDEVFYFFGNNEGNLFILDSQFNIIKELKNVNQVKFLPYSEKFAVWNYNNTEIYFYQLSILPFYKRITEKTYITIAIVSPFFIILLLILWMLTMHVSRKKIMKQKQQIEYNHNKLEETTSLLINNEKMSILGTIAGSVAHEINSPLSAIYNSGQRLQKDDRYEGNENVNLIITASKRCKDIIEKFLSPVKNISDDKNSNPKKILEDWLDIYGKDYSSHNIGINMNVEDNLNLKISFQELYQILTNIMMNARDAVATSLRDDKHIDITIYADGDFGIIKIKDNGDGFDQQVMDNLYKPLITTKSDGKGSGIGLWLTKKLIDRNNGEINISSKNDGALVEIKLLIQEY